MIDIRLENAGKRFSTEWIFRGLDLHLQTGDSLAILGSNGSGKSTLVKSIFGFAPLSEGKIELKFDNKPVDIELFFRHISFCSPYQELYEELELTELVDFHFGLKKMIAGFDNSTFLKEVYLESSARKQVRQLSSGMKQRLRLGLAILSDTPVVLLDEPSSNLDAKGLKWYRSLMDTFGKGRCIVVASNHLEAEYDFCSRKLEVEQFKPA